MIVEKLNNGILVEDENRIIIAINDAFCEIFNIKQLPNELIGTNSETIIIKIKQLLIHTVNFEATINHLIENKELVIDQEFQMHSGRILARDFMPFFVKNEYKGHFWSFKDITSRKNELMELLVAKEQAKASALAKEQFLSIMSHEMRTPMNAVIGLTHLLITKEPKDEQLEYLKSIKYSADNLLELINNILDYSKIESGNIILEHIDFDIHQVIDRLENIFKHQTDEKRIRFMIHLNHNVKQFLKGDNLRLCQILINLIGNAIKFTEKGFVDLFIYNSKVNIDNIIFEVRDSGIGIEEEDQVKIFEIFTQANSENTRKYGGIGLGLATTKLLVQLFGGTITVKSKFGLGTSFFVELPFEIGSQELVLNTNLNDKEMYNNLTGKKILLVEDIRLNQVIVIAFLKQWGIETITAENGQEALNLLNSGARFNLILMDLQMPIMDGFTATQHIRNDFNGIFNKLPIIALSAATSTEIKNKAKQMGMNDFVSKPFDSKVLFRVISEYININYTLC
jgi:signal transduction histidine kinase/CheY-like chemotaxis protein